MSTCSTKKVLLAAIAIVLASAGSALAAGIADIPWDQANAATLRSFDEANVVSFLNEQRRHVGVPLAPVTADEISGFGWADPVGNGRYDLVVASSGPCAHSISILRRDVSGKVSTVQVLAGIAEAIRDLNGDGKDELIIRKTLVEYDCVSTVRWPAVYRYENGKYVDASRDFPKFYDDEVLPNLDRQIREIRARVAEDKPTQSLVFPLLIKEKILRMLGHYPTAGLNHANWWVKSDDPNELLAAAVRFSEIPGHSEEAKAARAAYDRALCERQPGMVMCRKLPRPKGHN